MRSAALSAREGDLPRRVRHAASIVLTAALATAFLGCGLIDQRRQAIERTDLIWTQSPQSSDLPQIVDRWELGWSEGTPVLEEAAWVSGRGSAVILSMHGVAPTKKPGKAAAERIVEAVEKATLDLQNQGLRVEGLHLDIAGADGYRASPAAVQLEWLGQLYRGVRRKLDDSLTLSATLSSLTKEGLESELNLVGSSLDWVLVLLYGQEYGAPDDSRLWDLEAALDRLRVLRAAEVPSRGLVNVGGTLARFREGEVTPVSDWLGCDQLSELARRSDSVFQFEGYFRQVFQADSRENILTIGDTTLPLSGQVQVARVTPDHLRSLRSAIGQLQDASYVGSVYRSLSNDPTNCLGIDPAALDRSTRKVDSVPSVKIKRLGNGQFSVDLIAGSEPTALGRKLYNFVNVVADSGVIDRVNVEGFSRYEFLDSSLESVAGLGGSGVRLFLPMLEPGTSASATFRGRGVGRLEATPLFRSATGESLETVVAAWPEAEDGTGD